MGADNKFITTLAPEVNFAPNRGTGIVVACPVAGILVVPGSNKRRWLFLLNDPSTGFDCYLRLPKDSTYADVAIIQLLPGGSVVFSMTGDMPWQGPVFANGSGGTATLRGGEIFDWPGAR